MKNHLRFLPTADAAILTSKQHPPPRSRPQTTGPIFDPHNVDRPIEPWSAYVESTFYPKTEEGSSASIPDKPDGFPEPYLRAHLADNERLRLSMLWYYTRDILAEDELLSGLQEKAHLAQEFSGWEFAVIGILDVHVYIRLATVGLELGILPRGETICAHTVTQPPGSVFLLPNLMEDWRFQNCPYLELGGLRAYAGAPLRLQTEFGDCVSLGSLCVASSKSEVALTKTQHQALVRLADWVVSDLVQCARARRQRERRKMTELLSTAQKETDATVSEEPVLRALKTIYPSADISLQLNIADHVQTDGGDRIPLAEFENNLWEDTDYLNEFILKSNHLAPVTTRAVRIIATPCDSVSGSSLLMVASKNYQLVFDDIDLWFVQACAGMLSQMWRKSLLIEALSAKEKFIRGFSHQLRTPIHGILGSVELLAEEVQSTKLDQDAVPMSALVKKPSAIDPHKLAGYLNIIKMAGLDLTSIVNNMITLNRWTDIALAERHYDLHSVGELEIEIEKEIHKLTSADTRYKTSIFLSHDLPPECGSFITDLAVLRDSLTPLIINAIQNTPEAIVYITISISSDRKQLIIDVEDNGRGIAPEHQKRIFEPYEKVDSHAPGAGLGLALASKFATLLHGSVDLISSDLGRGSHFRATFQEIECPESSSLPTQLLASKFDSLPARFFTIKTGSDCGSLDDSFTRFLKHSGFAQSDSIEDSLVILATSHDDPDQHRLLLSQVPSDQVVICPIPGTTEEGYYPIHTPTNVMYVGGLISPSTMAMALEKAQTLYLELKASSQLQLRSLSPKKSPAIPSSCNNPCATDGNSLPPLTSTIHPDTLNTDTTASVAPPIAVTPQPLLPSKITAPPPPPPPPPPPTVLIVDDNAVNLRIMEMYCRKRGFPSCSATDGQQAVEIFANHQSSSAAGEGSPIQLIFMDLQMPVCDGIEATQRIRSLEQTNGWKRSLVIVMTGQDTSADRAAAEGADADEYFVKPVMIKQLDLVVKGAFSGVECQLN
ncbi:hypothetical protein FE257_004629 [Aspergillus nanangensis]|uniref:histidine kinase n=1 Tax=Aspergillus nanangensis TaxID=2582783 RepID=A0AAD4CYD5_ASPNN|nr:hypothetical protein FE257_004629 [Aspergillus nanangensis]